jgi:hypothetical protein
VQRHQSEDGANIQEFTDGAADTTTGYGTFTVEAERGAYEATLEEDTSEQPSPANDHLLDKPSGSTSKDGEFRDLEGNLVKDFGDDPQDAKDPVDRRKDKRETRQGNPPTINGNQRR